MKQTILFAIAFFTFNSSINTGASSSDITAAAGALSSDTPTRTAVALTKNDETESDDDKTIVEESPTPTPETVSNDVAILTKREEFARLFVATVFAGKDAAIETFTVENMKWLVACTTAYMTLVRDATLQFVTFFVKLMNDLRAANTAPNV